jgi:hypothetical protein
MMFIKKSPNSHGFVNPRDIEQLWRDQFDWVYREMDYAIFPITIHPDVSGRPQVLLMLERVVGHINSHSGVRWMTMEEIAEDSSLQGQIAAALPSGWTMARARGWRFTEHAAPCRELQLTMDHRVKPGGDEMPSKHISCTNGRASYQIRRSSVKQ